MAHYVPNLRDIKNWFAGLDADGNVMSLKGIVLRPAVDGYTYIYDRDSGHPIFRMKHDDEQNYHIYILKAGVWTEVLSVDLSGYVPTDGSGKISSTYLYLNVANGVLQLDSSGLSPDDRLNGGLLKTGYGMLYYGSSVPSGYLLCNNTWVSSTTYSALNTIIGSQFIPYAYCPATELGIGLNWPTGSARQTPGRDQMSNYANGDAIYIIYSNSATVTTGNTYYVRNEGGNSLRVHPSYNDAINDTNQIDPGTDSYFQWRKPGKFLLPNYAYTYIRY